MTERKIYGCKGCANRAAQEQIDSKNLITERYNNEDNITSHLLSQNGGTESKNKNLLEV